MLSAITLTSSVHAVHTSRLSMRSRRSLHTVHSTSVTRTTVHTVIHSRHVVRYSCNCHVTATHVTSIVYYVTTSHMSTQLMSRRHQLVLINLDHYLTQYCQQVYHYVIVIVTTVNVLHYFTHTHSCIHYTDDYWRTIGTTSHCVHYSYVSPRYYSNDVSLSLYIVAIVYDCSGRVMLLLYVLLV